MGLKLSAEDLLNGLQHYTGSEQLYAHWCKPYRYTEGVQWLAEHAGAYWLLDAIVSWQHDPRVRAEAFQLWRLRFNAPVEPPCRDMWLLWCEDGNEHRIVQQEIGFSDFPLQAGGIDLYLIDNTILLPGEY